MDAPSHSEDLGDIKTRVYTLEEMQGMFSAGTPFPEGEIPSPPENIVQQIGELMDQSGPGSQTAKAWIEIVGHLMSLNIPSEENHPMRLNKACERIMEVVERADIKKDALYTALMEIDTKLAPAKPLKLTSAEFEKALGYLLTRNFISWEDDAKTNLTFIGVDE